jgi:hypothetical protein
MKFNVIAISTEDVKQSLIQLVSHGVVTNDTLKTLLHRAVVKAEFKIDSIHMALL